MSIDKPKAELTKKRRVRFHTRVKERSFYDYVEDEQDHRNLWCTSADYSEARKFEDALRECVSANKELYRKNTENLNAQGVLTHDQAAKKYALIDASIGAVIDEQDKQESAFYDDNSITGEMFCQNDERIAEVYLCHSYEALQQAQSRANRHAKHVQQIASEPSNESGTLSPSRFVEKSNFSRLCQRSKKSIMIGRGRRKLPAGPSKFVIEKRSTQEVICSI
ncbi:unnamed protein product [Cylindrotheca closterium]|uniref:Uncharacterized protein n=1 Tax=Cylindrotheca closterium TaxID=2856 RepID=A0AAD2PWN1_9STRA|nr:unnamed protein product [Cylindrotheca closterium]